MTQPLLWALTIWQPWAHFLALGEKRVENRDWPPPTNLLGQWIAIHAGKRYDKAGAASIRSELGLEVPGPDGLPSSAIVAVGVLDRVATSDDDDLAWDDPWFTGAFGWYLRDVTRIEPVPCPGAQKLWAVKPKIREQVRANFMAARAARSPVTLPNRPNPPVAPSASPNERALDGPTEKEHRPMPERLVHPGETLVMALSFASSLLIVELPPQPHTGTCFECRGCIRLAVDATLTAKLVGAKALLEHLDEHLKNGDAGAKDAIWKVEACATCRGAGTVRVVGVATPRVCESCVGSGKNALGRDRGVRRGVVVG